MHVDYVIIGQGVAGTFLSYYFLQEGKKIAVMDDGRPNSASRIASGIINPVTGRRVVETWMIDDLLPFATAAYEEMSELLGVEIAKELPIVNFHTTEQMVSAWNDRYSAGSDYIQPVENIDDLKQYFDAGLGAHEIYPSLLIDINSMLIEWKKYLEKQNCFLQERFNINGLELGEHKVRYKDLVADKVFFCNGTEAFTYDYFKKLPFSYNKGEAVIIETEGLPEGSIYKQSLTIAPYSSNEYWVGSSFEWDFEDDQPTAAFKDRVVNTLDSWLKLPYKIIAHHSSIRPASMERRPFVGIHPKYNTIGILNGMGTKGCSLAPFFAQQLVDHVLNETPITAEADLNRFNKILSL